MPVCPGPDTNETLILGIYDIRVRRYAGFGALIICQIAR
jgi:hypothetical protein